MKKGALILSLLFLSKASFAQPAEMIINQKKTNVSVVQPMKLETNYTQEELGNLNEFLRQEDYRSFYELLTSIKNVSKENYIKYLESKKFEGHVPIYWLIADHYAKQGLDMETHKWFYIALIMTQQDSYLCYDKSARNAPRKLMTVFPTSLDITRRSPQYINEAMREVIFFIDNLKQRSHPIWACFYGTNPPPDGNKVTLPKQRWSTERQFVYKRFIQQYQR